MRRYQVNIPRKVFNDAFLPFLESTQREQHFFGGSSSGKSKFLAQRDIKDLMGGDRNFLVVRNVGKTIRGSVFNEYRKVIAEWGVNELFKINKTDLTITCANGMQAICGGLDDVEKLKSITPEKGVLTDIRIEEATETIREDVKQLKKRLRGKSKVPKRITYSYNPILRSHWIYQDAFSGKFGDDDTLYKDDHLIIFKTTYKNNRFLEPDDIRELTDETDEYFYNVYTLGNWGVLGDVIFKNWKIANIAESDTIQRIERYHNGLDFGFSNDPTAFVRCYYHKAAKVLYIVEEWRALEVTNEEIAKALKPIINREQLTCDSAEPKSIRELKLNGLNAFGAKKGKDSINHGIQWMKGLSIIIDKRCQHVINNFEQYQWKKDKEGNATNIPIDRANDFIDATRYAMEDEMMQARQNWDVRVVHG